ncbi:MAG: MBL fold metallo-hydrolase [Victivallales bacterium]|nr:MBL fold metallo-hydrolase [Victivallales bacterium]
MKLTVLTDNNTIIDSSLLGEPGISFHIETENKKVLFDCGLTDVFIKNAYRLDIDILSLDYIVLSHNHSDHTGGLNELIKLYNNYTYLGKQFKLPDIVAHSDIFRSTYCEGFGEIGSLISENKLENLFNLKLTKEPFYLSENIVYLGEVPRINDFENLHPIGIDKKTGRPDYMLDDSALVYKSRKGLIIVTGCSHSGICNICEYAKKICNENRITDIIGGLHLQSCEKNREGTDYTVSAYQMKKTITYIKNLNLSNLYACHCTDLQSKIGLSKVSNVKEVGSGTVLTWD